MCHFGLGVWRAVRMGKLFSVNAPMIVLDAVHVVRAGFCPSTRMGKFAVPAVLGIALGLMRGEEPRHVV